MNLLDKLTKRNKPGLAVLLIPFFFACNDPTKLGLELERDDEKVLVNDTTLILPASSIFIDSLRTDQYSSSIFGRYADDIYGEVQAISNNSYRVSGGVLPSSAEGDSLEFASAFLKYDIERFRARSIVGGERVTVYQSSDTIFSNAIYLAKRTLTKKETPVADHTFSFDPEIDSVLSIPLQETFGRYLFSLLSQAGERQSFEDSLLQGQVRLDPLVLEPGENNQVLYALDLQGDSTGIFINMKSPNNADTTYTYFFRFNSSTRFTSLTRTRNNGELLSDLQEDYDSSMAETGFAYLDMIHGVHTKINLDPLINLGITNENIIFNSVRMTMEAAPTASSYINQVNQLRFFFTEDDGTINATAVQNNQFRNYVLLTETSYAGGSPTLLVMNYDDATMSYSGNLTLFAQILRESGSEDPDDYLTRNLVVLSPAGIGLGQTAFPKADIKLTVYYSTIKE